MTTSVMKDILSSNFHLFNPYTSKRNKQVIAAVGTSVLIKRYQSVQGESMRMVDPKDIPSIVLKMENMTDPEIEKLKSHLINKEMLTVICGQKQLEATLTNEFVFQPQTKRTNWISIHKFCLFAFKLNKFEPMTISMMNDTLTQNFRTFNPFTSELKRKVSTGVCHSTFLKRCRSVQAEPMFKVDAEDIPKIVQKIQKMTYEAIETLKNDLINKEKWKIIFLPQEPHI